MISDCNITIKKTRTIKIDWNYFIYDYKKHNINSIKVKYQNLQFNFPCNANINHVNLTMSDINKNDHIYDFKFKRIFVQDHRERAKAIYNKLYQKIKGKSINNFLDQFLEKYEYFKDWFFLEERIINNKNHIDPKARIFFCFIKPEKTLYPLYVDSEHITCPKQQ